MKYERYRFLDEAYTAEHAYVLSMTYPEAQLAPYGEHPEVGWLGWYLSVQTWRGNIYDLVIVYPYNYPEVEPRTYFPTQDVPARGHMYEDKAICVHSASSWSQERDNWTPAVGFMNAQLWLEMFEDNQEGRSWAGSVIPQDVRDRVRGLR